MPRHTTSSTSPPASSRRAPKRRPAAPAPEAPDRSTPPADDLLSALLQHLAPHTGARADDQSNAFEAMVACGDEIQSFATRTKDPELRERLDMFADLLFAAASAIGKSERRWSRLAFDLHDGAQQEVSALRMDLSILSTRLEKSRGDERELTHVLASARELDARLRRLDAGLRELVMSFDSPALAEESLPDAIQRLVDESAGGPAVSLNIKGDFDLMTRSQRIVVVRVVSEALANARQHSGATRVRVSVRLRARRVYVVVRDNGHGFAVKRTLTRAAKSHRLGLIGMTERARLLGGKVDIQSAVGGPTTISLTLPAGAVGDTRKAAASRGSRPARH